jgi:hypothetical protein
VHNIASYLVFAAGLFDAYGTTNARHIFKIGNPTIRAVYVFMLCVPISFV